MNTPLMIAIYVLLALIAVPATSELLRTARENAKRTPDPDPYRRA